MEKKATAKSKAKTTDVVQPGNLVEAINQVMNEVRSVEKNLTVGAGRSSYQGVSDKDVKQLLQPALVRAGLVILPIGVEPKTTIERWEETTYYNGQEQLKRKQSVLVETKVTYRLQHVSGEYIDLVGYGHGIDSQDKAPGKATTYALKYVLLYTFLIPTGAIDDTDNTHSDSQGVPDLQPLEADRFNKALELIKTGSYPASKLRSGHKLTPEQVKELDHVEATLKNTTK